MAVPELDAPHSTVAEPRPDRRVIEETETRVRCSGDGRSSKCLFDECQSCHGTGFTWEVTSRRVQLGVPFEEQAAHAYIKGLHAHVRKAAQSLEDAAKDFEKLGHQKQASACRQA